VSDDPIGFMAGDPNMRRYVNNAALTFSDPSGLQQPTFQWNIERNPTRDRNQTIDPSQKGNGWKATYTFMSSIAGDWIQRVSVTGSFQATLDDGTRMRITWEEDYVEAWGSEDKPFSLRDATRVNKVTDHHLARPTRAAEDLEERAGFRFQIDPKNSKKLLALLDCRTLKVTDWSYRQDAEFTMHFVQNSNAVRDKSVSQFPLSPFSRTGYKNSKGFSPFPDVKNPPVNDGFNRALRPTKSAVNRALTNFPPLNSLIS